MGSGWFCTEGDLKDGDEGWALSVACSIVYNRAKSILFPALLPLNPIFLRIFLAVQFHLKGVGLFLHDSMQK